MKHIQLALLIALTMLLANRVAYAQNVENDYTLHTTLQEGFFNPRSPEATGMSQYGDTEISLFSGSLSQELNLYTYSDNDFSIPVSIKYGSTGYKPGQACGSIGLGWYLNAGGVITREIRGIPDEVNGLDYVLKTKGNGSEADYFNFANYAHIMSGASMKYLMDCYNASQRITVSGYAMVYEGLSVLDTLDYAYTGEIGREYLLCMHNMSVPNPQHNAVELEPDIYKYNFLGYSGSFILRPNGRVMILDANTPAGELTITYNWNHLYPEQGTFEIKTGDGMTYTFGLRESAESLDETNAQLFDSSNIASDWKLTRITTQTGRTADFIYETDAIELYSYQPAITIDHVTATDSYNHTSRSWLSDVPAPTHQMIKNIAEDHQLTEINVSGRARILFSYDNRGYLSGLSVMNQVPREIHYATLNYTQRGSFAFLKSVTMTGVGTHSFEYYDENATYPLITTKGIDWYGYYNGNESWYTASYPENTPGALENIRSSIMSGSRSLYNLQYTRMGMLKRITYPTGGSSVFTYELNKYGRDYNTFGTASQGITTGGVRVSKIEQLSSTDSLIQKRTFAYLDINGGSSGILTDRPLIYNHYTLQSDYMTIERECVSTTTRLGFARGHIEYIRVVETLEGSDPSEGKVIKEHLFNSSVIGEDKECYYDVTSSPVIFDNFALGYDDMGSDGHESQRHTGSLIAGRPSAVNVYSDTLDVNHYVSRTSYNYAYHTLPTIGTETGDYLTLPSMFASTYCEREVARMSAYRSSMETMQYNTDHQYISTLVETRTKNALGRTNRINSYMSDGNTRSVELEYDSDRPAFLCTAITKVNGSVNDGIKYQYGAPLNLINCVLPYKVNRAKMNGGGITGWTPVLYFDYYDSYGNPVQTRDAQLRPTAYLWGYNGMYLTVKMEGMTYYDIRQTWPVQSGDSGDYFPWISQMLNRQGVMTSVWQWDPLVGITAITDPSGRKQTFTYDSDSFLHSVSKEGTALQYFDYYISNYETE